MSALVFTPRVWLVTPQASVRRLKSVIQFVDLAGSERYKKSKAEGKQFEELKGEGDKIVTNCLRDEGYRPLLGEA